MLNGYLDESRNIRVFRWSKGKNVLIRSNGNFVLHPPINGEETLLGNVMDRTISELWDRVPKKYKNINYKLTTDIIN